MVKELLSLILLISVVSTTIGQDSIYDEFTRYVTFKDGNGVQHNFDLQGQASSSNISLLEKIFLKLMDDQYLLFTRDNPTDPQTLYTNDVDSIKESNFNVSRDTAVIVHGWLDDANSSVCTIVRDAYLEKDDVNVIVVDWSKLAHADYLTATLGVPLLGRALGRFLGFLNSSIGLDLDTVHVIGFSLGAHFVGNAGKELGGKLARITGLDPAGPLWGLNLNRLQSTDAIYVEVIHTDCGQLGTTLVLGDMDFYPNGGVAQPGCSNSSCSHSFSYQLFASSLTNNRFVANECQSYLALFFDFCSGKEMLMGNDDLRKRGSGKYRLKTGADYPYYEKS